MTVNPNRIIPDISKQQLHNLMVAADEDESGELARDEFIAFVNSETPAVEHSESSSRNSEADRAKDAKIADLQDKLRSLTRHWSTGLTKVPLGPQQAFHSDVTYKNHVLRLSEVYTEYVPPKEMDYKNFVFPMLAPPGPLQLLYGTNGLTRLSPRSLEKQMTQREKGWNGRFTADVVDSAKPAQKKKTGSMGAGGQTLKPPSRSNSPKLTPPHESVSMQTNGSGYQHTSFRRNRCLDDSLPAAEVAARGLYRLDPYEEELYNRFVEILTKFDEHDMDRLLEDVRLDVRECTLLNEYGGFG
jgi:hypothetical protein